MLRWVLCTESVDERQIYFLANIGSREKRFRGRFRVSGLYPWLFDAESGSVTPLHCYKVGNGSTEIELRLEPCGSAFVCTRDPVEPVELRILIAS